LHLSQAIQLATSVSDTGIFCHREYSAFSFLLVCGPAIPIQYSDTEANADVNVECAYVSPTFRRCFANETPEFRRCFADVLP
jgi:hypothetical protein